MRKIIIDTDTGSDDAIALIMALRHPDIKVVAITTVAGNVPIDLATKNAKISIGMADTYVPPVYEGCGIPLYRKQITAQAVHGLDGLGDVGYQVPDIQTQDEHAVDAIARLVDENDDVELVTLGPLTNIAMAIKMYPQKMAKVKSITAMGAQFKQMNPYTPCAEFNMLVDPEAVDIVLRSGIYTVFIPFDVCFGETAFSREEMNNLLALGTKQAKFFIECNRSLIAYLNEGYGQDVLIMPDPTAMAFYIDNSIAKERIEAYARCETKAELTVGEVLFDYRNLLKQPINSAVIPAVDGAVFKQMIFECCKAK